MTGGALILSAHARLAQLRTLLARIGPATARRNRRHRVPFPVAADPDPAYLLAFPGEAELPADIRDAQILIAAMAWRERMASGAQADPPVRAAAPPPRRKTASRPARTITNVLFVSHCDFTGNSALHAYSIATELHRRGLSPIIAVPQKARTVEDIGRPPFAVVTYRDARRGKLHFPDGRGPDLVHAFTPRELVRKLTADIVAAHGCPYVVHLEDNEEAILSAELGGVDVEELRKLPAPLLDEIVAEWQSHPLRARQFLDYAAGITVVIERLLELAPQHVRTAVVCAGFDEAVLSPGQAREDTRATLGLALDDLAVVYTGNIHATNLEEMRGLYAAVAQLREAGHHVVLVKTGWSSPQATGFPDLGEGLKDLGWVPRAFVPDLLAAADVLVQPGAPGPFNDYRFPSKLPEFLASGRPVVLPRTNVGRELRDGQEALVLEQGDADEIAGAIERLAADPELRRRLGKKGRAFALRKLRWPRSVDAVEDLYGEVAAAGRPPAPAWVIAGVDPPVKLIAVVEDAPSADVVRLARAHGVYGFCLAARALQRLPDAPFCVMLSEEDARLPDLVVEALASPLYLHANGVPLVFASDADTSIANLPLIPFDAAVERTAAVGSALAYTRAMERHVGADISVLPRFRALTAPPEQSWDVYAAWLSKLTLQAILLAEVREPLIFLDGTRVIREASHRDRWLEATISGLATGAAQAYASCGVPCTTIETARIFGLL